MKLLIPSIVTLFVTGCTQTIYTHRADFSPAKRKGPWTDYYQSVKRGETPEAPKERQK